MMALGVCFLLLFAYLFLMLEPDKHDQRWRDTVVEVPLVLGVMLCAVSLVVWLWRVMP
jgi:hypothetical protein